MPYKKELEETIFKLNKLIDILTGAFNSDPDPDVETDQFGATIGCNCPICASKRENFIKETYPDQIREVGVGMVKQLCRLPIGENQIFSISVLVNSDGSFTDYNGQKSLAVQFHDEDVASLVNITEARMTGEALIQAAEYLDMVDSINKNEVPDIKTKLN